MTKKPTPSTATLWARFRFSVIGSLLSAPPPRGELKPAIQALAEKIWTHPVTGRDVQYAASTIECWYYKARNELDDPVRVLQRAVRKDRGKVSLGLKLAEHLRGQYREHPHWSYQRERTAGAWLRRVVVWRFSFSKPWRSTDGAYGYGQAGGLGSTLSAV